MSRIVLFHKLLQEYKDDLYDYDKKLFLEYVNNLNWKGTKGNPFSERSFDRCLSYYGSAAVKDLQEDVYT